MKQKLHLYSPKNWINDPNGFLYYKGQYHLFYQYFPYALRWGTMHWGHAVSRDLTHWEHQDIALFPTIKEDENGCFSGSAIEHEGKMYLIYTGVYYKKCNPVNIHECLPGNMESSQLMITSEDGCTFDNFAGKKVIIPTIWDGELADSADTRDPKVWKGKEKWNLLVGSTLKRKKGEVLFFQSENLQEWKNINRVCDDRFGWMWECPDYFETEGGQVLVFSPIDLELPNGQKENHAVCMPVQFQEEGCEMKLSDTCQLVDHGMDFYAPQSTTDEEGRRVIIGWMRMPQAVENKWIGMFSYPRLVKVKGGHIYFPLHPNVKEKFSKRILQPEEAEGREYCVKAVLQDGEYVDIGGFVVSRQGETICTDRTKVFPNEARAHLQCRTEPLRDGCTLAVYVCRNLIEVFVNDGEYVISNVVYGLQDKTVTGNTGEIEIYTID